MTLLITGATGGFGRIFSAWTKRHAKEDIILTGRADIGGDGYVQCDMRRPEEIRALIERVRPRLIFHLAGSFLSDYEQDHAVNAGSAKAIFDALLTWGCATRVVLFSSAAEYGVVSPEENPIREDHVLRPVSIYGLTKAFQTQLAYYYAHAHGLDVVVARLFNLRVPGLSERLFVGRVEQSIARLKRGEIDAIEVGNLEGVRDYVTGEEAIRQTNLIALRGRPGEVYHIGSGVPTKVRDLLDTMLHAAGLDWSVVRMEKHIETRTGYDVPAIYADMSKTRALSES